MIFSAKLRTLNRLLPLAVMLPIFAGGIAAGQEPRPMVPSRMISPPRRWRLPS